VREAAAASTVAASLVTRTRNTQVDACLHLSPSLALSSLPTNPASPMGTHVLINAFSVGMYIQSDLNFLDLNISTRFKMRLNTLITHFEKVSLTDRC
jgi:hypothetical protein